jgi:hypothetical protein
LQVSFLEMWDRAVAMSAVGVSTGADRVRISLRQTRMFRKDTKGSYKL